MSDRVFSIANDHLISSYNKALLWIKENTIPEQGIAVSSVVRFPYLEVTGYLIPTLFDMGEVLLAERYAEFLSYMQRPNGSFLGTDGREYVFDTGQALRGLIRASQHNEKFRPFALKAADYVASCIERDGRIPSSYGKAIPEYVHVFVLPPLVQAGKAFNKPDYCERAEKALTYYMHAPDVLDDNYLTHFLAYTVDGFVDMQETEFVRPVVKEIFSRQRKNGSIPALPNARWTCSVGLAQLAIVGYKLGMCSEADKAVDHLCKIQNPSGGFYGSYGFGANYFPREEISWANKFFLDAVHLKTKLLGGRDIGHALSDAQEQIDRANDIYELDSRLLAKTEKSNRIVLDSRRWHDAIISRQSADSLADKIRRGEFPVWCRPILQHTSPGDSTLELGSGTGQLSAILGIYHRVPHLLDYSRESIEFGKRLFRRLGIEGHFYCADILEGIPMQDGSVDWVWSSGTLEHLSGREMASVLQESVRVCSKGVMSLVPNANSIFYRIGKFVMEQKGAWPYGRERPFFTMRKYFEAAGLKNIREFSVGTYHSVEFWGSKMSEIKSFYDSLSLRELEGLNQGYLLFTYGER
jgi:malonyl-CoA O-methyltransferase